MMSDMPDTAFLQEGQRFPDQTVHGRGGGWSNFAFDGATAYVRADKYAELKRQRDELVELLKTSVAEFDDGVKYPLEVVNDLKKAIAKAEKDDE